MRAASSSVSLRRKGWPVQPDPPPDLATIGDGWTSVLDEMLQGWQVSDVLEVFEAQDPFFRDWHQSLGDTCVRLSDTHAPISEIAP